MHAFEILALALLATPTAAHGVVTLIRGANGVDMPGLSVVDGTPRDCSSNRCGSQADTAIMRGNRGGPLGRTQGSGPVDAAKAVSVFMGTAAAPASSGRGSGNVETRVSAMAGNGASSGLPTASDDGVIELVYRQINQDGAGPVSASIDPTSGGTDASAFQTAEVIEDVPGRVGLSLRTSTDFTVRVQMPRGMTCEGTVAGVQNVCIVRVRNPIGFGGSAAFTQSAAARKRAIEERKRRLARAFTA